MNNTKWIYRSEYTSTDSSLELDKDTLNILYNRGITEKDDIERFLSSSLESIGSPFSLKDVEQTVKKLLEIKKSNGTVWIYGDYDVDGITSTSLCYLALTEIGIDTRYYIPLRDEGYGLNNDALTYIKEQGADLVITVDCGISSIEEIDHANSIGLDVVITDHHEINGELPKAFSVINPKRQDNEFDYPYLAGVGTAFMLILGLYETLGMREETYKYLDIVAIGTIADIVPLRRENRVFAKHGLKVLESSHHTGLRVLLKALYPDTPNKTYNTYDVGFIIAPVFNAAGRLEDAKMGVQLMITDSRKEALELSAKLISQNSERKEIQASILEKVEDTIEINKLDEANIIVAAGDDFHHGVIGIVASKIVDRYYKPTVIMEIKREEGVAVASCRSIENYNLIEGLNSMKELFVKYGGHAGAAGFSIPIENISEFTKRMDEHVGSSLHDSDFQKPIKIDKEILPHRVSYEFLEAINKLEPFGFGNATPVFTMKNCLFKDLRLIGKDKNHMMLTLLKDGNEMRNAVWFSSGHCFEDLVNLREVDIAFKLKREVYKDRFMHKIYIEDVRASREEINHLKDATEVYDTFFPLKTIIYSRRKPSDSPTYLNFGDGINISQDRQNIGYLDRSTASLIKKLKYDYKFDFNIRIQEVIQKDENYNIHIEINRNYKFETLSYKKGDIFKEIKSFLIGEFQYNHLQKRALSSIFKDGRNTCIVSDIGRGIGVILKNIGIYNKLIDKKTLIITSYNLPREYSHYFDISSDYKENYDYYIYLGTIPNSQIEEGRSLVVSHVELDLDNYNTIVDHYLVPTNVEIVSEEELIRGWDSHLTYYSKKLVVEERLEIYKNLDKYHKVMATRDILAII